MNLSPEVQEKLMALPDDELMKLAFVPWQYSSNGYAETSSSVDSDGFPLVPGTSDKEPLNRDALQKLCWNKYGENPQINTNIRNLQGRLTGWGFETSSDITEIQTVIEEIELDWRNRLYTFWPKFVGRSYIEGELFLELTCHPDSFIEVDFIDPSTVTGGGSDGCGITFHSKKDTLPLAYHLEDGTGNKRVIPSIFVAYDPNLFEDALQNDKNIEKSKVEKSRKKVFASMGGYYKFVTAWDKSLITHRNVSYLKTVIAWINQYETLKKYEIDHKKSAGAYLWIVSMTDPKAFRLWLTMSDEDKRKTGIMAKKTPGGTMVLPPGMEMKALNPTLPRISDQDTDILHMVTAGLNEPEDIVTGESRGTFASVKASRGPMSDRIADEAAYFERFLRYDFWRAIFILKSKIKGFPRTFSTEEAVEFKEQEPVFRKVKRLPEQIIEISFPTTEMVDAEARARAYLGVKHGSTYDTLGIPNRAIADKMGLGNYRKMRLEHATEQKKYPELIPTYDQESFQETTVTEPARGKKPKERKEPKEPAKVGKNKNNE